jgi:hypothetical protein
MAQSSWITLLLVAGVLAASTESPKQNLTAYLLQTYNSIYEETITGPTFFAQVLNGSVNPLRVAYFFEQVPNSPPYQPYLSRLTRIHRTPSTGAASQH